MRSPPASSIWPCSPERSRHCLKIWWGKRDERGDGWLKTTYHIPKVFNCWLKTNDNVHKSVCNHVEYVVWAHIMCVMEMAFQQLCACGAPIWNLGQPGTLPLTIIMALIIHPRPPCMTQHTTHIYSLLCISQSPTGGRLGRAEEVGGSAKAIIRSCPPASRSHVDHVVILDLFWIPTKAALGLGLCVNIDRSAQEKCYLC